jgi:hypothetical protein
MNVSRNRTLVSRITAAYFFRHRAFGFVHESDEIFPDANFKNYKAPEFFELVG